MQNETSSSSTSDGTLGESRLSKLVDELRRLDELLHDEDQRGNFTLRGDARLRALGERGALACNIQSCTDRMSSARPFARLLKYSAVGPTNTGTIRLDRRAYD